MSPMRSPLHATVIIFAALVPNAAHAADFGTTYSSGGLTFGGGDSNNLIKEVLEKGLSI